MTRRQLQIALGFLWLLDGALQAQPFMFTRDFATQVIAPSGHGQPAFVSAPVERVSTVIAADPVAWSVPFAGVQLLLGAGLLMRRTARLTLAASIAWALGVWYLGEGFGGLAGGDASLTAGAPGSALLLATLAAAAWPDRDASRESPASWLPFAWAVVWVGGPSSRRCRTTATQRWPSPSTSSESAHLGAGRGCQLPRSGWRCRWCSGF